EVAQQHRDLPVLHQLVGEPGIAACDLLGDDREGLHLARLVELDAAELLRHAEGADADLLGSFEDFLRQPVLRRHHPFALPVVADERENDVVDERAARLPHEDLLFGEIAVHGCHFPGRSCVGPTILYRCGAPRARNRGVRRRAWRSDLSTSAEWAAPWRATFSGPVTACGPGIRPPTVWLSSQRTASRRRAVPATRSAVTR